MHSEYIFILYAYLKESFVSCKFIIVQYTIFKRELARKNFYGKVELGLQIRKSVTLHTRLDQNRKSTMTQFYNLILTAMKLMKKEVCFCFQNEVFS